MKTNKIFIDSIVIPKEFCPIHWKIITKNCTLPNTIFPCFRFDYSSGPHYHNLTNPDPAIKLPIPMGATLGDDLNFILPKKYRTKNFETKEEEQVSRQMLGIVENFVNGR